MPYMVVQNGSSSTPYCVYKKDANNEPIGESLGCHPTQKQAQDQIVAILLNESGEETMNDKLSYTRAYPERAAGVADDPNMPIRFVASTEGEKSDGMNLKTADWLLGRFEKHPVVLYAHDYMGAHLPLGSGKPFIDGGRLLMDVTFDLEDDFARQVRSKTVKGLMGGSVGWQANEKGNELLEFSIVPVPLDPDALPMRQARGRRALQDWLDEMATDGQAAEKAGGAGNLQSLEDSGGARIGAVISARNLKDLETARDLIGGVIDRAKKEAAQADDKEKDEGRGVDYAQALQNIQNQLSKIQGA